MEPEFEAALNQLNSSRLAKLHAETEEREWRTFAARGLAGRGKIHGSDGS
jgi:hypothetical protein